MSKHPKCRWLGHDLNFTMAWYYSENHCRRCKEKPSLIGWREMAKLDFIFVSLQVRDALERFAYWWRCSDCGRRFGRHDESVDHLPF